MGGMVRRDTKNLDTSSASFEQSDRGRCLSAALQKAEEICNRKGVRFTDLRRRVFQVIWQSQRPLGAYDILEEISKWREKKAPPTVYRATDFLLEHDLIHRLESLNAFVSCPHPGERHTGVFLICEGCRKSAEVRDRVLIDALQKTVDEVAFKALQAVVEVKGRCADCRKKSPAY